MVSDFGLNVAVEQAPVSWVEPVADPRSVPPVGAASAAQPSPACALQQESEPFVGADHHQRGSESVEAEGVLNRRRSPSLIEMPPGADDHSEDEDEVAENGEVVASSEPVESIESSVGAYLLLPSSDEEDDEDNGTGASSRRSTRIRKNVRMSDYEIELPESLVIQAVHMVLEPPSVDAALSAPDAEK